MSVFMNGLRQNNGIEVVVIVILSLIAITYIIIIIRGQRHLKSMNLSDLKELRLESNQQLSMNG